MYSIHRANGQSKTIGCRPSARPVRTTKDGLSPCLPPGRGQWREPHLPGIGLEGLVGSLGICHDFLTAGAGWLRVLAVDRHTQRGRV